VGLKPRRGHDCATLHHVEDLTTSYVARAGRMKGWEQLHKGKHVLRKRGDFGSCLGWGGGWSVNWGI